MFVARYFVFESLGICMQNFQIICVDPTKTFEKSKEGDA